MGFPVSHPLIQALSRCRLSFNKLAVSYAWCPLLNNPSSNVRKIVTGELFPCGAQIVDYLSKGYLPNTNSTAHLGAQVTKPEWRVESPVIDPDRDSKLFQVHSQFASQRLWGMSQVRVIDSCVSNRMRVFRDSNIFQYNSELSHLSWVPIPGICSNREEVWGGKRCCFFISRWILKKKKGVPRFQNDVRKLGHSTLQVLLSASPILPYLLFLY